MTTSKNNTTTKITSSSSTLGMVMVKMKTKMRRINHNHNHNSSTGKRTRYSLSKNDFTMSVVMMMMMIILSSLLLVVVIPHQQIPTLSTTTTKNSILPSFLYFTHAFQPPSSHHHHRLSLSSLPISSKKSTITTKSTTTTRTVVLQQQQQQQQQRQQLLKQGQPWYQYQKQKQNSPFLLYSSLQENNDNNNNKNEQPDNNNNNNNNNKNDNTSLPQHKNQELNWKRIQHQTKLLINMSVPYYQESNTAKWLLGGVLLLTIANSGISVLFSYTGKDFWNALSTKDTIEFYKVLGQYVLALGIGAPVATLYKYQREQLAVHWREWMTIRTYELYSSNQVYYKLERLQVGTGTTENGSSTSSDDNSEDTSTTTELIDNPDQRITEDVRTFTSFSLQLLITILTSIIDLVSFSAILYSIYPQLFVAVILYALFGTVITALLGKSLVSFNFLQLQKEADLRYLLVRLRDNAESIAFYGGEELEGKQIQGTMKNVMDNKRSINTIQRNLEFFTNGYRYFIQILPVAVVAPRYFAGEIALGVISQSAGAFNHILSDLSILINQFEQISAFSAGIERLSDFYTTMRYVDNDRNSTTTPLLSLRPVQEQVIEETNNITTTTTTTPAPLYNGVVSSSPSTSSYHGNVNIPLSQIELNRYPPKQIPNSNNDNGSTGSSSSNNNNINKKGNQNDILVIQQLDLCTPDKKRLLIQNLSFALQVGEHLLIVGNSGTGKSSLLRAIAGLWNIGNGCISRPADEDVYFLPQRPYCTMGSLKDQLLYPSIEYETTSTSTTTTTNDNNDNNNEIMNQLSIMMGTKNNSNSTTGSDDSTTTTSTIPPQKKKKTTHYIQRTLTDQDLLDILQQVDLYDVAVRSGNGNPNKGLYAVQDWSNQLSLGEQQRLAFGRLLVNKPSLVILDEATSALDIANEARMYTLLKNMAQKTFVDGQLSASGLTYISVGHRPSLINFHEKKLRLGSTGGGGTGTNDKNGDSTTTTSNQNHEFGPIEKAAISSSFLTPTPLAVIKY